MIRLQILLLISVIHYSCSSGKIECVSKQEKQLQQILIKGIIEKVDEPDFNHGLKLVVVKNYTGGVIYHHQVYELDQAFYKQVAVGDSIIKNIGFLDIILIKPDGSKKLYKFNCSGLPHDSIK
jgi:alpha-galactosidase